MNSPEDAHDRLARGKARFEEVTGEQGSMTLDALARVSPDLGRYILEFGYGDIYSRPGLDLRQRQLITLGALTALGGTEAQLHTHIHGALNVGISRDSVVEAVLHCLPFVGFPRTLNAMAVVGRVFKEADGEPEGS